MKNVQHKSFTIYKHTNIENGKVYIGITSKSPKNRWQNGNGYKTQKLFWRAIQKYGWSSFKSEILFENLTKKDANIKEIELIELYQTNNNKFGYNISKGGESGAYGIIHSQESKNRMSKSHIGLKHTKETKDKIGKNSWTKINKGNITFSEEHKQKMRNAKKDISKMVICIETKEVFCSVCEASRSLNIDKSSISRVCTGKRKTCNGLHFKYCTNGDRNEITT